MTKYKYYFKKPKGEIVKDLLGCIVAAGVIYAAASSPYFILNVIRANKKMNRHKNKEIRNAFYRLKKDGSISVVKKNHQIYITLTEKGRRRAGMYQINHLRIKKPKKWDKKWRVVIFDVTQQHRAKREALRGFLKRLNFYLLQKSVWVCPYDCRDEIYLLKDFFGFAPNELRLIVSGDIGDDLAVRRHFKLNG